MWVVLLFTVYPGDQQQWVSLTYVNQEIIADMAHSILWRNGLCDPNEPLPVGLGTILR